MLQLQQGINTFYRHAFLSRTVALSFYASLSGLLLPEQGMDGKSLDSEVKPTSL